MQRIIRKLKIEDFEKSIGEEKYPEYFTEMEIKSYGKRRKKGSLAARYLLKNLLIEYIDGSLKHNDIEVLNNNLGKPVLKINNLNEEKQKTIYFSISHSKDEAIVLFVIDTNDL